MELDAETQLLLDGLVQATNDKPSQVIKKALQSMANEHGADLAMVIGQAAAQQTQPSPEDLEPEHEDLNSESEE